MAQKLSWHIYVLFSLLITIATTALAQVQPRGIPLEDVRPRRSAPALDWQRASWSADGRAYRRIQAEVDKLVNKRTIQNRKAMEALLRRHKTAFQANRNNPQKAFQWAYAAYNVAIRLPRERWAQNAFNGVEWALGLDNDPLYGPPFPNTYEYARLCFLVAAKSFKDRKFKTAGVRLAKRNPNDFAVKWRLIDILEPGTYLEDKQQALTYAQDLLRIDRKRAIPQIYMVYGRIYWASSRGGSRYPADAEKAIFYYQKYLQSAPPDAPNRRTAEFQIKDIRRVQALVASKRG